MRDEISILERALSGLVGLRLSQWGRAADMLMLDFGNFCESKSEIFRLLNRPAPSVAEISLHIQCAWRFESDEAIVTGRSDLWCPTDKDGGEKLEDWNWEIDGNIQDARMEELFSSSDPPLLDNGPTVQAVTIQTHGSFTVAFSDAIRLLVFPSGSEGEDWRLLHRDSGHLVVAGGKVERKVDRSAGT